MSLGDAKQCHLVLGVVIYLHLSFCMYLKKDYFTTTLICTFVCRHPTVHGIPRQNRTLHMSLTKSCNYQKNMFALDSESKPLDFPNSINDITQNLGPTMEGLRDTLDEAPKDQPCEAPKQVHLPI